MATGAEIFAPRAEGTPDWEDAISSSPRPLATVAAKDPDTVRPLSTGLDEIDRVLGGGLLPGSVTLLGGSPGMGKSTLILQVADRMAAAGALVLLHSAEESAGQVHARALRIHALAPRLLLSTGTDVRRLLFFAEPAAGGPEGAAGAGPDVVVVDSIQAVSCPEIHGPPGSVAQVRASATALAAAARRSHCAVILVGQVTKGGELAGPRSLEHLVDTVLSFEGDRHHALRVLRVLKHRFGPAGEIGLFEMTGDGLSGVEDPTELLLGDRRPGFAGSAVLPLADGRTITLVEVQALVAKAATAVPRRSSQGLDAGRLTPLLAVLDRHASTKLGGMDVFVSVVGGLRAVEPAADLATAVAIVSAASGRPVPSDAVVCGEVGLAGELRRVGRVDRRIAEAARVGFRRAVVPPPPPPGADGIAMVVVDTVREALEALWCDPG